MEEKRCTYCHEFKILDEFRKNKNRKDGHEDQCRECRRQIGKVHDHKESRVQKRKAWTCENRDKVNSYTQKWADNNPEKRRLLNDLSHNKNRIKRFFYSAKNRALKSGADFELEFEDIIIPDTCPILGIPLKFTNLGSKKSNEERDQTPSIDRIDNNKGYIRGNVWIISLLANVMKNKGSFENLYNFSKFFSENIKIEDNKHVFKYNNSSHTNS